MENRLPVQRTRFWPRRRVALDQTKIDVPKGKEEMAAACIRLYKDLLHASKVRRQGSVVDLCTETHITLEWLVKAVLADWGL